MRAPRAGCLVVSLFAFACSAHEPLPPLPGGGGPVHGGNGDAPDAGAPGDAADDDLRLAGRVCRVLDPREPTPCAQRPDMSMIRVAELDQPAETFTTSMGRFSLEVPPRPVVVLDSAYGDDALERSLVSVWTEGRRTDNLLVPAMDSAAWGALLEDLDAQLPDGTGALVVYLRDQGQPVADAEITQVSAAGGVFYDDDFAGWVMGAATGSKGVGLVLGLNEPVAELTTRIGASYQVVTEIPIRDGAVTFVTVDLVD